MTGEADSPCDGDSVAAVPEEHEGPGVTKTIILYRLHGSSWELPLFVHATAFWLLVGNALRIGMELPEKAKSRRSWSGISQRMDAG